MEDQEIIEQILAGETDKFKILLDRYQNMVFGLTMRRVPVNDVEDVAHETFIRAFRNLASFRGDSSFGTWLRRIALRNCCDFYRKRRIAFVAPALDEDEKDWLEAAGQSLAEAEFKRLADRKDAIEIVRKTLSRLDPEDRALVEMVYFDGMPVKEAAKVLEKSVTATKVKAMRARHRMRSIIENYIT